MRQLNWHYDHHQITTQLAHHLHSPPFWNESDTVFNFDVHLLKDRNGGTRPHIGRGFLTLPTQELGNRFLQIYGNGSRSIWLGDRQIFFEPSNTPEGKPDVVETIRLMPYRDPEVVEEEQRRSQEIADQRIPIQAIQFCWKCRDGVLSVEAEHSPQDCVLFFDEERRQLRVKFFCPDRTDPTGEFGFNYIVAIRLPTIVAISAHTYLQRQPVLVLYLNERPTYERGPPDHIANLAALLQRPALKRAQLSFLPSIPGHQRVAPFTSLAIRLVLPSNDSLHQFHYLARLINLSRLQDYACRVDRRGRFSQEVMDQYEAWLPRLSWQVSYQVASIVLDLSVDVKEMLEILPLVEDMLQEKGREHSAALLRDFKNRVKALHGRDDIDHRDPNSVRRCFEETVAEFSEAYDASRLIPTDGSLYQSLHITITPTTMLLEGPYPERSNRVIRNYDTRHHESFLRVTFAAEGRSQFQVNDRDLDQRAFVRERFGSLMLGGLRIAGRRFEFLAYSQSALKEHCVL